MRQSIVILALLVFVAGGAWGFFRFVKSVDTYIDLSIENTGSVPVDVVEVVDVPGSGFGLIAPGKLKSMKCDVARILHKPVFVVIREGATTRRVYVSGPFDEDAIRFGSTGLTIDPVR